MVNSSLHFALNIFWDFSCYIGLFTTRQSLFNNSRVNPCKPVYLSNKHNNKNMLLPLLILRVVWLDTTALSRRSRWFHCLRARARFSLFFEIFMVITSKHNQKNGYVHSIANFLVIINKQLPILWLYGIVMMERGVKTWSLMSDYGYQEKKKD